jgi:NhaP-type Na+/H+ or K+/H+ antiporter
MLVTTHADDQVRQHFGTRLNVRTVIFLGWFGPRGPALILFARVVVGDSEILHASTIMSVTIITALMSTFLHSLSAAPGADWYARHDESRIDRNIFPEHETIEPLPTRFGLPGAKTAEKPIS